jgi:ribosomal protein S15P/S13E
VNGFHPPTIAALTKQVARIADHLENTAADAPLRTQLATLIERWEEVAEAYKPKADEPSDDITARYANYRLIYLRNIRDLQTVLDTGRMPCGLMTATERANGDCGHVHADEEEPTPGPADWRPIVVGHLAEMLLDGEPSEALKAVQGWARGIAFELDRVGLNIDADIEKRRIQLAPGTPPVTASEPPF